MTVTLTQNSNCIVKGTSEHGERGAVNTNSGRHPQFNGPCFNTSVILFDIEEHNTTITFNTNNTIGKIHCFIMR